MSNPRSKKEMVKQGRDLTQTPLDEIDDHIDRLRNPRFRLKIPIGTRHDMNATADLMDKIKVAIVAAMTFDDAGANDLVERLRATLQDFYDYGYDRGKCESALAESEK